MGSSKHPEQVRKDAPSPIQVTGVDQVDRAPNAYRDPIVLAYCAPPELHRHRNGAHSRWLRTPANPRQLHSAARRGTPRPRLSKPVPSATRPLVQNLLISLSWTS